MSPPLQVDLWPFDLKSGVRVTCEVAYLYANCSLSSPLCSRLRLDVHDRQTRQTDVRRASSLNASAQWGGVIMTRMINWLQANNHSCTVNDAVIIAQWIERKTLHLYVLNYGDCIVIVDILNGGLIEFFPCIWAMFGCIRQRHWAAERCALERNDRLSVDWNERRPSLSAAMLLLLLLSEGIMMMMRMMRMTSASDKQIALTDVMG